MGSFATQIYRFISESSSKVNFSKLQSYARSENPIDKKTLKRIVNQLVEEGKLRYTTHFGGTYIEVSYDAPQQISDNVVIKPSSLHRSSRDGPCAVFLERGASFGGGEHPSTRLAIRLMDAFLYQSQLRNRLGAFRAVDIGTGTGVLAIVAAKMGVGSIWGVDIDPCCVFEARRNVLLNDLDARIRISGKGLDLLPGSIDLVLANLRFPTLFALRDQLDERLECDGMAIFSGLRIAEMDDICSSYERLGFFPAKKITENDWGAVCLLRGDFLGQSLVSTLIP